MSFIIPPEERTTEGPYSLSATPRALHNIEVIYTEMMIQLELNRARQEQVIDRGVPQSLNSSVHNFKTAPNKPQLRATGPLAPPASDPLGGMK